MQHHESSQLLSRRQIALTAARWKFLYLQLQLLGFFEILPLKMIDAEWKEDFTTSLYKQVEWAKNDTHIFEFLPSHGY